MIKSKAILIFVSALVLVLHACSLDFAAWMDEVHIVEMGRLALLGGGGDSILTNTDGSVLVSLYYLGPMIHELAFRLGGPWLVRFLPMVALVVAALFAYQWFSKCRQLSPAFSLGMALIVLTMPLFVQSVRMVRVDMAVIALGFAILALIDRPYDRGSRVRLGIAAVLAVLSPFVWPSAVMLYPLYAVYWFRRRRESEGACGSPVGDVGIMALMVLVTLVVVALPIRHRLVQCLASFGAYFRGVGVHAAVGGGFSFADVLRGILIFSVKETLRAPIFCLLLPLGLLPVIRRQTTVFLAFLVALSMGVLTGLHTFRNLYLFPYLLIVFGEAVRFVNRKSPAAAKVVLATAALYGLVTGPIAYCCTAAAPSVPMVSPLPGRVLNLDYSRYYQCRQLGVVQRAYPVPSQAVDDPAQLMRGCDAVFLPRRDRYQAIEESYTLYGVLRDRCLEVARREAAGGPSTTWGRIGNAFAYDDFTSADRERVSSHARQAGLRVE